MEKSNLTKSKIHYKAIIIGSGFSGMLAAIQMQKEGINDFLILESEKELGGTWYQNAYPGAAVDVQSQLYSFSFEPFNWTRKFAHQEELLHYTNYILDKYKLREKAITESRVVQLKYNESTFCWKVSVENGQSYTAENLINATGILSQPSIPDFKGKDTFAGKSMHTSRWDNNYDYTNKKVAVIGTGASAIQVIPAIADKVAQLTIFQRTPHWVLPRPDRKLFGFERMISEKMPFLQKLYRGFLYWQHESRLLAFRFFPMTLTKIPQFNAKRSIKKHIGDENLLKQVTPNYTIGCKRVLLSNTYYPTLMRENVQLLSKESGINHINSSGVRTIDDQQIDVDLIVYATGFHASENNIPYPVIGREGRTLEEEWKNGAHAYLGTMIPHFPNFYILGGPNTGIGHTSAIHLMESQMFYIMKMIQNKERKS